MAEIRGRLLIGGMTLRHDGQLLLTGAATDDDAMDLLVFDPESGNVNATFEVPALPLDGGPGQGATVAFVQSLAWPLACPCWPASSPCSPGWGCGCSSSC